MNAPVFSGRAECFDIVFHKSAGSFMILCHKIHMVAITIVYLGHGSRSRPYHLDWFILIKAVLQRTFHGVPQHRAGTEYAPFIRTGYHQRKQIGERRIVMQAAHTDLAAVKTVIILLRSA